MDTVQRIIQDISEPRIRNHDWQAGQTYHQPYYTYSPGDKRWHGVFPPSNLPPTNTQTPPLTRFSVYSWNIDFMLPCGKERLTAALNHIHHLLTSQPANTGPSIIFLQEMTSLDLRIIQAQPWIQTGYHVTDITNEYWASEAYGTCTLIPKTMNVGRVFRVHYEDTNMERDGLFVDVLTGMEGGCVRFCNTHLESLALEPPIRPSQMRCAARFMRGEEGGEVLASVLGGDLNAIQEFDRTLHADNGLGDAYLASGGEEGAEEGMTWGQMASTKERDRFGLSRMDKLFFCGAVTVEKFERFGYGIEVDATSDREQILARGFEKPWITDHLGVKGVFSMAMNHEA